MPAHGLPRAVNATDLNSPPQSIPVAGPVQVVGMEVVVPQILAQDEKGAVPI